MPLRGLPPVLPDECEPVSGGQGCRPLCRAETVLLSASGSAVGLEMTSLGKTALLAEVAEDGRMDSGKLL